MRLHYAIAVPVFPIRSRYFLFLKEASIKDVLLTRGRGNPGGLGEGEGAGEREEGLKIQILAGRPLWMLPWVEYWTGIMRSH